MIRPIIAPDALLARPPRGIILTAIFMTLLSIVPRMSKPINITMNAAIDCTFSFSEINDKIFPIGSAMRLDSARPTTTTTSGTIIFMIPVLNPQKANTPQQIKTAMSIQFIIMSY